MATGRDVAERAGTSTAVVSYVFNNGPRNVSPATRERVLRAAAELNYRPNALARALSAGKTLSVGLVVPDIANPYFGELARELEQAATARGRLLLIADSAGSEERELQQLSSFIERRVDGIVLVSVSDDPQLDGVAEANIPIVALHPLDLDQPSSSLTIDYDHAAEEATRHLVDHGYASIGLLNGPTDSAGARQHAAGFTRAILRSPGVESEARRAQTSRADAARVALEWLAEAGRPRAVYAATDEQAFGVLYAAAELGLRVPEDVAVVGFDGTIHSEYAVPPLSTVRQPIRELASRAIEVLIEPAHSPVHETLPHRFLARRSCGCHAERTEE
ncbi:LacI family DNA-binding transcriptional regulator [Leifsonia xyli]|uniref:LacI family DNA-binding transcriptional regulator n=1 Tax=Leifsonia xyli TaxID=1575 RepID=UPI003D668427